MTDYPTLSPCIMVNDAARAAELYKAAFGTAERCRLTEPESGQMRHAELIIGNALLMLSVMSGISGSNWSKFHRKKCRGAGRQ